MSHSKTRAEEYKALICELMRGFYAQGWCSGTGGGISILDRDSKVLYMAPSGVQKERMKSEDIFELDASKPFPWSVLCSPTTASMKLSECAPLFAAAYEIRSAGAVLHSHALNCALVTTIPEVKEKGYWAVTGFEMIKGIRNHKNTDTLIVPVIKNTEREAELTERLKAAIEANPKSYAILVENHGVYIWGDSWEHAKTQAECYHYLFDLTWQLHIAGQFTLPLQSI